MRKKLFALGLLAGAMLCGGLFSGCAQTEKPPEHEVGTLPWNRPERWEGQGMLGGFQQQY
jgi:hypothetical protein